MPCLTQKNSIAEILFWFLFWSVLPHYYNYASQVHFTCSLQLHIMPSHFYWATSLDASDVVSCSGARLDESSLSHLLCVCARYITSVTERLLWMFKMKRLEVRYTECFCSVDDLNIFGPHNYSSSSRSNWPKRYLYAGDKGADYRKTEMSSGNELCLTYMGNKGMRKQAISVL